MDEVERVAAARALGAALRNHRMAKGLSLRALAKQIGLSAHGTLVDYEHGRRIPPEDLLTACEKALDLDDGTLRRLRLEALAERASTEAALLLKPPAAVLTAPPALPQAPAAPRPPWRRFLVPALILILVAVTGAVLLVRHESAGGAASAGTLRFGFETSDQEWDILWGAQKAKGEITDDRHYEGTHSFQVTMAGPSMEGPGPAYGYVAFGTTHGLESLHAGMRVTMHLWTSYPKDGFQFMVYNEHSTKVNAPETPRDGSEMSIASANGGWATVTWTVPAVTKVNAIIVQPYQRDDTPRVVAVDAVSW